VEENRASGGAALVMDPYTGEILSLASEPTFNPNTFRNAAEAQLRNRAVQDLYEPGSTFKVVTASAALDERLVGLDDPFDVSAGMIRFGSRQIDDVHRYGVLSFTDVIVKSSNVGAVKVGLKLGPERLGRYVRRFGFGRRLTADFPSENPGIVWDPALLNDSALASVSMGYQVGVTPLQMAAAVSSIANGGELVQPMVVRAIGRGSARVEVPRKVLGRTVTAETAAALTSIMEAVVERGTARAARVPGYTVAGKTGTAQKVVGKRYSKSDYFASFVGFAPARKPVVTIIVVIDSPKAKGYYGGAIAAPVFQRVAEAALRHLGVAPDVTPARPVIMTRRGSVADAPVSVKTSGPVDLPVVAVREAGGMPDLRGLSAREATRLLARLGMSTRITGDGVVVDQNPSPGSQFEDGSTCRLVLERVAPIGPNDDSQP
jgi:cell division protein FtsI (penicillin-binding protein 3)